MRIVTLFPFANGYRVRVLYGALHMTDFTSYDAAQEAATVAAAGSPRLDGGYSPCSACRVTWTIARIWSYLTVWR